MNYLKRNPVETALFGGAALLALLNIGGIKEMLDRQQLTRQLVTTNNQMIQQLETNAERQRALAEIANQRYDAGCEVILSLEEPGKYRALALGVPIFDGVVADKYRNDPKSAPPTAFLPAGKTVCDSFGNTAVLEDSGGLPVTTQMATTEDRERIRKAMARVKAQWNPPVK